MKNRLLVLLCAMAALSPFAASNSVAGVSVGFSVSVFDGPLSQCGYWIDRAPYGRCWYPAYVSSSWRPYCNGYWMWTDDGWYWVSDEPWAWACYHYGRWVYDSYYGWIWVPDTVWGPSWVAWRSSDDYVGWAPLPPECRFGAGGEFVFREEFIRPSAFVFVDVHHFSDHIRPHTVIVNNVTIINKTVNVTKIRRVNNVVVNNGPNVDVVQRFTPRKFTEPPVRAPRWSGFSTPPHPAPEVLQPSAVRAREQAEGRFSSGETAARSDSPQSSGKRSIAGAETCDRRGSSEERRGCADSGYRAASDQPVRLQYGESVEDPLGSRSTRTSVRVLIRTARCRRRIRNSPRLSPLSSANATVSRPKAARGRDQQERGERRGEGN